MKNHMERTLPNEMEAAIGFGGWDLLVAEELGDKEH